MLWLAYSVLFARWSLWYLITSQQPVTVLQAAGLVLRTALALVTMTFAAFGMLDVTRALRLPTPLRSILWVVAAIAVPFGIAWVHARVGRLIAPRVVGEIGDAQRSLQNLGTNVFAFVIIAALRVGVERYDLARARLLHAARVEHQLALARIENLTAQLQPHYLFNALHTISSLIEPRPGEATRMVTALGDLLRSTLSIAEATIPLQSELRLLDTYLEVERGRFGERLSVRLDIAPDAHLVHVPAMILQPLVENAIKHGRGKGGTVTVDLRADLTDGLLSIMIRDSGPGLRPSYSTGIGIRNTRERLAQLYGGAAELVLSTVPGGGAVARLTLPGDCPEAGLPVRAGH